MRILKYLITPLLFIGLPAVAHELPSCPAILQYVQSELPHYGVLRKSGDFVYVDVNNDYIYKLVPFIRHEGFQEPPYFGPNLAGAHISVVYGEESRIYNIEEIAECGQIIYFTPKECKVVHPQKWREMDEVYFVSIDAPELDKIRKKYGLPKPMYDYHITIGVKPRIAQSA